MSDVTRTLKVSAIPRALGELAGKTPSDRDLWRGALRHAAQQGTVTLVDVRGQLYAREADLPVIAALLGAVSPVEADQGNAVQNSPAPQRHEAA